MSLVSKTHVLTSDNILGGRNYANSSTPCIIYVSGCRGLYKFYEFLLLDMNVSTS